MKTYALSAKNLSMRAMNSSDLNTEKLLPQTFFNKNKTHAVDNIKGGKSRANCSKMKEVDPQTAQT